MKGLKYKICPICGKNRVGPIIYDDRVHYPPMAICHKCNDRFFPIDGEYESEIKVDKLILEGKKRYGQPYYICDCVECMKKL